MLRARVTARSLGKTTDRMTSAYFACSFAMRYSNAKTDHGRNTSIAEPPMNTGEFYATESEFYRSWDPTSAESGTLCRIARLVEVFGCGYSETE